MSRLVLVALPALLCAYIAGRLTAETSAAEPAPAVASAAAHAPARAFPTAVNCRASLSAADLETLQRELTAALAPAGPAADRQAPDADPAPAPFVGDPARAAQALAVVDHAVASGRWRDEDALRLGNLMIDLDRDQQRAAVAALTAAINQQQLDISVSGPLF